MKSHKTTRLEALNKTLNLLIIRRNSRGSSADMDYEIQGLTATIKRHNEAMDLKRENHHISSTLQKRKNR